MIDNLVALISKVFDKLPIVEVWRARSSAQVAHDQKKFNELDNLLPEITLKHILDDVFHQRIERFALDPIDMYLEWAGLSSNKFLIRKIQKSQTQFNTQLRIFRNFLFSNLFTVREDQGYLYFRPDQDPSRGNTTAEDRKLFDERIVELDRVIGVCETAYRTFRETIKSHIYI